MFEPLPELSPDLDWMLESGQASREMLALALVEKYARPVYRLALSILDDPQQAERVSLEIFSQALLNVFRYRSHDGVHTWFYRVALRVIRRAEKRLRVQRGLITALPLGETGSSFGVSQPKTELEARLMAGSGWSERTGAPAVNLQPGAAMGAGRDRGGHAEG